MIYLSASAISAFKACPFRWWAYYGLGCRPAASKDVFRIGTNWHTLLELSETKPGSVCPICKRREDWEHIICPVCGTTQKMPETDAIELAANYLNFVYERLPVSISMEEMLRERAVLLHTLIGYRWFYSQQERSEVIGNEVYFRLPVIDPDTGRQFPGVRYVGKIDKLVRKVDGTLAIREHKSTSRDIRPDSEYWGGLNIDEQTSLYLYAVRQLQKTGGLKKYGVKPSDAPISKIEYDVWHKPTIRPKKLSFADTKTLIDTGMYCSMNVAVEVKNDGSILVNGNPAEVEQGKKEGDFAIRENGDLFGARLRLAMATDPSSYFACRDLVKTDAELAKAERQAVNVYKNIRFMLRNNAIYSNEHSCKATFKCDYMPVCYTGELLDADHCPQGFEMTYNKEKS